MKDLRFLLNQAFAHRGVWNINIPENSLSSFSRAIQKRYPIELDVQMCKDGDLVIFHDWNLKRMTGCNDKISNRPYSPIKQLTLKNSDQKISLLAHALELINGTVPVLIEIKIQSLQIHNICENVYQLIKKNGKKIAISSFNPFIFRWFKLNAPEVVRGQIFTDFRQKNIVLRWINRFILYSIWVLVFNKPDFFVIKTQMLPNSFPAKLAQRQQRPILAWNITNKSEYDRIIKITDNIIYNYQQ